MIIIINIPYVTKVNIFIIIVIIINIINIPYITKVNIVIFF